MTTGQRNQAIFWISGLLAFLLLVHLLSSILLPFVAASAIAYFLDPAVRRLEQWRVPRTAATLLVLLLFMLGVAVVLALLVPLLQIQIAEFAHRLPALVVAAQQRIEQGMEFAQKELSPEDYAKLRDMLGSGIAGFAGWAAGLLQQLLTSGVALANVLLLVLITPVVAFFLLRDWDHIVALVDSWLPRQHLAVIREQARLVDATLAGYVRGQLLVCLGTGLYYALALTIIGLDFGLIVGILAGILTFIPYVGYTTGFVLALGLGLLQFGNMSGILWVVGVFAMGQVLEGNILAPKLVGDRVHLHPVLVIFALLAFGALFGFLGVLLALPAAAVLGVLTRFALGRYLRSSFYDSALRGPGE